MPELSVDRPVVLGQGRGRDSDPCVAYTPRPDATPEGEIAALAAVYRLVIERA